ADGGRFKIAVGNRSKEEIDEVDWRKFQRFFGVAQRPLILFNRCLMSFLAG
ncbi:hypothetical protein U1Q18_016326, partial [Sarracenia purpurea var. burkii]